MKTNNGMTRMATLAVAGAALWTFCGTSGAASVQDSWGDGVNWNRTGRTERIERTERTEQEAPPPSSGWLEEKTGGWISERLTIGLGVSFLHLTDNRRAPERDAGKTFIGNVNLLELKEETPWTIVATYWAARYLRASLTWESVEARTYNYNKGVTDGQHGQTDGVVEASGPVVMLEAMYPFLDDTLFPHVGGGVFFANGDFHEEKFWYLGYSSPESYAVYGKPETTRMGYAREIHVDDDIAWLVSAGIAWRPIKHLQIDLDVRQTWLDLDCDYGNMTKSGWESHRKGDFSLDNTAWTLSAAYVF